MTMKRRRCARIRRMELLACAKDCGECGVKVKISKREECGGGDSVNNLCGFL